MYCTNIQCNDKNDVIFLRKMWKIDTNVQYNYERSSPSIICGFFNSIRATIINIPYTCFLVVILLFEGRLSNFKCC